MLVYGAARKGKINDLKGKAVLVRVNGDFYDVYYFAPALREILFTRGRKQLQAANASLWGSAVSWGQKFFRSLSLFFPLQMFVCI